MLDLGVVTYAGTPLSGPGGAPAEIPPGYGRARAEITAFEALPEDFLAPLASAVTVVAATGPGRAFPPSTLVNRAARVGTTPADAEAFRAGLEAGGFGRHDRLGELTGDLGPDCTTLFRLESRTDQELPQVRGAVRESLEVRVRLEPDGSLTAALVVADVQDHPPALPLLEGLAPPDPPEFPRALHGETAVLALPPEGGPRAVTFLARSPFDEHRGVAIGIVIELEAGPDFVPRAPGGGPDGAPGGDGSAPRSLRGLEVEGPVGERPSPGLEAALPGLGRQGEQRAALLFLARESGARLAADAVLSLPDSRIAMLAARVAAGAGDLPRPLDPAAAGWILEREALLLCIEAVETEGDELVVGLLLAHTGDVGRYPADLKSLALASPGLAAFDAALVRENLIHLGDNSPAARVRAFDWLLLRGLAPGGYDPLGSREKRRVALDAAANGTGGNGER